jgi:ribonucleoside-diphosphate reductase alpha chain
MDSLTLAISQGSLRRGSAAVYLDIFHPEIEEFLEIRKPSGDFNRKSLNLHHGISITDEFMEAVRDGAPFGLRSPKDNAVVKTVDARTLWQKILEIRLQTGEPYLIFSDTVNRALPQHQRELGLKVRQSNLCSEIMLHTGKDHLNRERTAVCCLSSVNAEKFLEWRDHPTFIEDVMRFLDNVLQDFIDNAPPSMEHAVYAAMRERSVGLGLMGFHSFLQGQNVPFESAMAKSWNMRLFKALRRGADRASEKLAQERGACPDAEERGVMERFSHKLSVAPTASISIIWLLRRQEPLPGGGAAGQGSGHHGGVEFDPGERGLGHAPRLPDPGREGRVQDRLRTGPALGGGTGRRPHAGHLPVPVGQHLPARRRG